MLGPHPLHQIRGAPHKMAAPSRTFSSFEDRAASVENLLSQGGVKCFGAAGAQASERCFRFASAASSGFVLARGSNSNDNQVTCAGAPRATAKVQRSFLHDTKVNERTTAAAAARLNGEGRAKTELFLFLLPPTREVPRVPLLPQPLQQSKINGEGRLEDGNHIPSPPLHHGPCPVCRCQRGGAA